MIKTLPEAFEPKIGLSSVASVEETDVGLPDDSRLQPIDAAVEAQLRAILQAHTMDAVILEAVKPKAYDRTVLAPPRFHALREEVTARLQQLEHVAPADQRAELQAAAAVLRARSREHELGETMRYALLKG